MANGHGPPGVKPVFGAAVRCRKVDGGGAEPVAGPGRGHDCGGGDEEPASGAGRARKCNGGGESVLGATHDSQGDGGGVRGRGRGGGDGGVEFFSGAGRGGQSDGGGIGPVPCAGRRGQGDGGGVEPVPGAGRGEEGHGEAARPPPYGRSNPLLLSQPACTSTESQSRTCSPFKALSLIRKKSTGLHRHNRNPCTDGIVIRDKVGCRGNLTAWFLNRKISAGVPLGRVLPENHGISLTSKVVPYQEEQRRKAFESEAPQHACSDAAAMGICQVKPCQADQINRNIGNKKDAAQDVCPAGRDRFKVKPYQGGQKNKNLESELSWGNIAKDKDSVKGARPVAAARDKFQVKPSQADQINEKDAPQDACPDSAWRDKFKDNQSEDEHRRKYLESELVHSCGGTLKEKDRTHDICPAAITRNRCQVVGPGRRKEWGKNFELRFGNRAATKQISAEASVSSSGCSGAGAKDRKNTTNQDLLPLVVSSIHDLVSFNPQTTIIEFDSELEGRELGQLFRIARVLKFTRFVPNYTLARARLHYICSSCDGELHGRNLEAEVKSLLCSHKKKK